MLIEGIPEHWTEMGRVEEEPGGDRSRPHGGPRVGAEDDRHSGQRGREQLGDRLEVSGAHRLDPELPEGRSDAGGEADRALEEGVGEAAEVMRLNFSKRAGPVAPVTH